jgi:hypothetical protein
MPSSDSNEVQSIYYNDVIRILGIRVALATSLDTQWRFKTSTQTINRESVALMILSYMPYTHIRFYIKVACGAFLCPHSQLIPVVALLFLVMTRFSLSPCI